MFLIIFQSFIYYFVSFFNGYIQEMLKNSECNGYLSRMDGTIWDQTLFSFYIEIIPTRKAWIHIFSL